MITLRRVNCFIYMIHTVVYSLYTILIYLDLINEYLSVGVFLAFSMFAIMCIIMFMPNLLAQLKMKSESEFYFANWFFQICFLVGGIGTMWVLTFYILSEIGDVMEWTWLSAIPFRF